MHHEIRIYCGVGQRAYFATRFLTQLGYRACNLPGGFTAYQAFVAASHPPSPAQSGTQPSVAPGKSSGR